MKLTDVTSETVLDGKFITVNNILTASSDVYSINNNGWSLLAVKGTQVFDWDKNKSSCDDFVKNPATKGTLVVDFAKSGNQVSILQPYDFYNVYNSYNGIKTFDFVGTNKGIVLLQATIQYLKAKYAIVDYDPDLNIYSLDDIVALAENAPSTIPGVQASASSSQVSKSAVSASSPKTGSVETDPKAGK